MIRLEELPFKEDELETFLSEETIEYHYKKHHASYLSNLNKLIEGTKYGELSLSSIIRDSDGAIFNNAAQVFNHTFYWNSISKKRTHPTDKLLHKIMDDFGSLEVLREEFLEAGSTLFGSGWVWLVRESNGKLKLLQTQNADTPLSLNLVPLFVCDVWEHAYYIDYRNLRPKYLEEFWNHINWDFVSDTFKKTDNDVFIGKKVCDDIHDPFCDILQAKVFY